LTAPFVGLWHRLEIWYRGLIGRIGLFGLIATIPLQLLAFLGDSCRYVVQIFRQALNPLVLMWLIITLPAVLMRLLISRLIGALLMPWTISMLDRLARQGAAAFRSVMARFPWMKRVLVGYLR